MTGAECNVMTKPSGVYGHCRATQLLTWFMIPFSQGFDDAGDFTILGRCTFWSTISPTASPTDVVRWCRAPSTAGLSVPRLQQGSRTDKQREVADTKADVACRSHINLRSRI